MKPILCLDFDGVIHSYTSGWKGADVIPDDVVPGFFEWAEQAARHFELHIFSSRSRQPGERDAMMLWLAEQRRRWRASSGRTETNDVLTFEFPEEKPPAFLSIDDRGFCFEGTWPDPAELLAFRPWNKRGCLGGGS